MEISWNNIALLFIIVLILVILLNMNQPPVQTTQEPTTQYVIATSPWEVPFYFDRPYNYFYPYIGPTYYGGGRRHWGGHRGHWGGRGRHHGGRR